MTDHHETVVVDTGGGTGMGMILGIIAVLVLFAVAWFFILGPGRSSSGGSSHDNGGDNGPVPTINVPTSS